MEVIAELGLIIQEEPSLPKPKSKTEVRKLPIKQKALSEEIKKNPRFAGIFLSYIP
jgi:hypothetical protein